MSPTDKLDRESCYRAVKSRDRRFDGVFYTAVRTTGIYCRPSCPARTPALANVTFHPTAAAAQAAGYRACKRCLPDATPGSPDWDVAADVAGRAMRLIADGVVDREGVDGPGRAASATPRATSTRLLTAELGAGPLALARAQRAQTARVLIETTDLTYADVAFAAGFSSVRQFNDTIREVYATHADRAARPARRPAHRPARSPCGSPSARRTPARALLDFLATRAIPGVEAAGDGWYARTLALPARHRHRPARDSPTPTRRRRDGVRDRDVRARRPARHLAPPSSASAGCSTPTATRSRWPTRSPATR